MYYDKEKQVEISEQETRQAVSASGFTGDVDEYLEQIESGKFGEHCQVGCNAYWTSNEDFDPAKDKDGDD